MQILLHQNELVMRLTKKHLMCSITRAKIFRLYAAISYTNKSYYRFGHKESPKCTFCEEPKQDFIHLFITCPAVIKFREELEGVWKEKLTGKEWFFGNAHNSQSFLIRESNLFIHANNWAGKTLNLHEFKAYISAKEKIEAEIAKKRNKVCDHINIWEHRLKMMDLGQNEENN